MLWLDLILMLASHITKVFDTKVLSVTFRLFGDICRRLFDGHHVAVATPFQEDVAGVVGAARG